MDKSLFENLVKSLKEAQSISKSEMKASRRYEIEPSNPKIDSKKIDSSQSDSVRSQNVDSNGLQNGQHKTESPVNGCANRRIYGAKKEI
ncbi:hypothetical protein AAKU61_004079 [Undibacterium sp. GrIS 1.2]|uniref:hypothetical protein n=1 Tax=Undibacterium sp. GrIS 1.2 TaxID=3143933 RepID=UPI00339A4EEB